MLKGWGPLFGINFFLKCLTIDQGQPNEVELCQWTGRVMRAKKVQDEDENCIL